MKRTILTIAIITILVAAPLWAQSESDFEVRQNPDNTITITGYNGSVRDIVIPETLYGLRVTVIGESAFYDKNLTSVVISNSVITIEGMAFQGNLNERNGNQLNSVTLGNRVATIGWQAFAGNQLTEIIIPDSVTSIVEGAFHNNNLRKVTFGRGLRNIGQRVFAYNLIIELSLPASLESIGQRAFADNLISKITFPASLRIIEGSAFSGNQLRSLTIPNGVTSVGERAFENNTIETLVIPASLAGWGLSSSIFNQEKLVSITLPANMNDNAVRNNFGEALQNFWISQNRAAGTYVRRGPIWTRLSTAEAVQYFREQEETRQTSIRQSGEYNIGDRGPGGGIIFYVNFTGFTVDGYGTAHYLEAAPVNMGELAWKSNNHQLTDIAGTKTDLGSGRRNTDLILAVDQNAPAAKACKDYRGGGLNDWFLPSAEELNLLFRQRALFGISNGRFWSSSQYSMGNTLGQLFDNSGYRSNIYGNNSVRAIRAF